MSRVLDLTRELIRRPSITPDDAGCQNVLGERLAAAGFDVNRMDYGDVRNLWARLGDAEPLFVFAGHTDVVPTGPEDAWSVPPFEPTERDGELYGRGAADMKGSLAAMIVATEDFLATQPKLRGSLGFLITSDEEGPAIDGTAKVVKQLGEAGTRIDCALVGEPSSSESLGDTVRNGRRGSLNATLHVNGVQGHVAYPDTADNPIHAAVGVLDALCRRQWDTGNADFPATSFQVSNINAGTGADNVIPGRLEVLFNFRFNTEQTPALLQDAVTAEFDAAGLNYDINWRLSGMPFVTPAGPFTSAVSDAVASVVGQPPALSTSGGTSDGRFIAPAGADVVELGPINATIHKVDERVSIADLDRLADIYGSLLRRILEAPADA